MMSATARSPGASVGSGTVSAAWRALVASSREDLPPRPPARTATSRRATVGSSAREHPKCLMQAASSRSTGRPSAASMMAPTRGESVSPHQCGDSAKVRCVRSATAASCPSRAAAMAACSDAGSVAICAGVSVANFVSRLRGSSASGGSESGLEVGGGREG